MTKEKITLKSIVKDDLFNKMVILGVFISVAPVIYFIHLAMHGYFLLSFIAFLLWSICFYQLTIFLSHKKLVSLWVSWLCAIMCIIVFSFVFFVNLQAG